MMDLKQLGMVLRQVNKDKSVHIKTGSKNKARLLAQQLEATLDPYSDNIMCFVMIKFRTETAFVETTTVVVTTNFIHKVHEMEVK